MLLCSWVGRGQVLKACFIILFCNTSKSSVLDFKVFNVLSVRTYYISIFFSLYGTKEASPSALDLMQWWIQQGNVSAGKALVQILYKIPGGELGCSPLTSKVLHLHCVVLLSCFSTVHTLMQKTQSFLGTRELLTLKVNAVNAVPRVWVQALQYLLFNSAARWSFSAASLMIKIYAVKTFFLLYATMEPTSV